MTYTVPAGRYGDYSTAFIQAYIDQAIDNVVGLAPETLNSLQELAAALGDDPAFFATVAAQVAELNTDVTDVVAALGITENDSDVGTFTSPTLPDGTTLRAVLEAFASAYDTTKSNLEAADTALSGRLDTLEADPTTAAAVAAVQADVDQNELDSDAADLALSNRLDVLEADPTTQAYVDNAVSALVDLAPGTLDTLNELAEAIGDDADFIGTVNASIAAVQADVDQNEIDSDAAESALSGRLDVLEADPTTATAVAAVQADVDQNELDSDAADAALSGRLDTLEADPTTAAAVAAVQADVDQNEIDSDAADSALSGRLDTLEADPTTQTAVDAKLNIANPAATGDLTVDTQTRLEFDGNITKLHNDLRGTRIDIGNNITVYPAAANGRFEIEGGLYIRLSDLEEHNNDNDAAASGIVVGGVYYDGNGHLKIRRT